MAWRATRALTLAGLAATVVTTSGCLLISAIAGASSSSDSTPAEDAAAAPVPVPVATDAAAPGAVRFGAPLVIARTAPGLRGVGVDAARVYFANEATGEVRFAPKKGDGAAGSSVLAAGYKPTDVAADATRVYWIQDERDRASDLTKSFAFSSVSNDGTDLVNGGSNYLTSSRMTFAGGRVFTSTFTASAQWGIRRDGTLLVHTGGVAPKCVVSDGTVVYYELSGALHTFPEPEGGAPLTSADATDLAVDETSLYWITSSGAVQKVAKSKRGATPIELATGLVASSRIALDAAGVYVTARGLEEATGRIVRIPKAGGVAVDLATGLHEPWGLAVDGSGVYVTNHGDGTVIVLPRS